MQARKFLIDSFTDSRGNLVVGEFPKSLPFAPLRFFCVDNVPQGESRGNHAHRTNEQALFCLAGEVIVKVYDGNQESEFSLVPGAEGLYLPAMHWAEQVYVLPNSQLLVLASEPYSNEEYIHSLLEFDSFFN